MSIRILILATAAVTTFAWGAAALIKEQGREITEMNDWLKNYARNEPFAEMMRPLDSVWSQP
jgi:uncharacterized protein (DUF305 family)